MSRKRIDSKINECLRTLCLAGMRECYEEQTRTAEKQVMSHATYLLGLLEKECESRQNKRIVRYLRNSRLPLEKRLDNFDMKHIPLLIRQQINALTDGGFLNRKENVLVFGNPGSGKTHLVCGLAQELIKQGYRVLFSTCSKLVQELLAAKRDLELPKMLAKLSKYEALIIDDIGYVQQNKEEMEILFTLLAERYENGSVMITSNLPFSKWETIFKDKMVTAAAIDRLVHHSVILEMNLKSYRMTAAQKKLKTPKKGVKKAK